VSELIATGNKPVGWRVHNTLSKPILRIVLAAVAGLTVLILAASNPSPHAVRATSGCPSFSDPILVPSNQTFWDFAFDGTCEHVFMPTPGVHQVQVLDLQTLTFEAPIPVGMFPSSLDITPDGSTLYVTNSWEPTISVVDVASRQELRKINIPPSFVNTRPYSMPITVRPCSPAAAA
jgi:YVTN family beta-propeller protein